MSGQPILDKAKVRHAFGQAAQTYDAVTQLQRDVGNTLLQNEKNIFEAGAILDIGCGTGFLTDGLLGQARGGHVVALDLALPMLQMARNRLQGAGNNVAYLCADAEKLPLARQTVDVVYSNLALQWCMDLAAVFVEVRRVLKPGGRLVFSIFGPRTLQELKQAWACVDSYRHVNFFYSLPELGDFLRQAGFVVVTTRQQAYCPRYASVRLLMQELKAIGAHNVNTGRNKHLTTKTQLHNMMAAYPVCGHTGDIVATFEVFTLTAQA